jgi:hypothetical protein
MSFKNKRQSQIVGISQYIYFRNYCFLKKYFNCGMYHACTYKPKTINTRLPVSNPIMWQFLKKWMFLPNFFSWHYFGNLLCFSSYRSTILQPNNFIWNWKIFSVLLNFYNRIQHLEKIMSQFIKDFNKVLWDIEIGVVWKQNNESFFISLWIGIFPLWLCNWVTINPEQCRGLIMWTLK